MATEKENLERQLGKDNADAIDALVAARFNQNSEQLEALRREFNELREQLGDIPELRERLRAIRPELREAVVEHNRLADRRDAGEPVSREEVVEDDVRVQRVTDDVESVRDELERRVTDLEDVVGRNDNEGLRRDVRSAQSTADEALRLAQSTTQRTTTSTGSKSGLVAALITFAVVFVFAWLWIMITGEDESWLWAVAWAGIFGGLVGLVVGIASKEGTRTNTFLGDLRNTRNTRRERQQEQPVVAPRRETVESDVDERPEPGHTRVVERRERERVNA